MGARRRTRSRSRSEANLPPGHTPSCRTRLHRTCCFVNIHRILWQLAKIAWAPTAVLLGTIPQGFDHVLRLAGQRGNGTRHCQRSFNFFQLFGIDTSTYRATYHAHPQFLTLDKDDCLVHYEGGPVPYRIVARSSLPVSQTTCVYPYADHSDFTIPPSPPTLSRCVPTMRRRL
jgi:hypothetical protein